MYQFFVKEEQFAGCSVMNDIETFKSQSDEILSNRYQKELDDVVGRTLQGVCNSIGHRLLYRGIYPGEVLR